MHRYFVWVVVCFALVGCRTPQTFKDAWKGTRSYYYEYLNTPAMLDLSDKGGLLAYQAELGAAVANFDIQLQELERALQNSDRKPDAEWVTTMTTRFPWLSGIALTDEEGIPRAKVPPVYPKPFEIGTLLEADPKQQLKDLRAFVQRDDLGPEIYLGNPVYVGTEFKGIITVHFDPRTLLARAGDPTKVMLAGPGGVIWPGPYDPAATPVAGMDWEQTVKSRYSGLIRNNLGTFYWMCRYLGNFPLIYAIKVEGEFPLNEENMRGLEAANAYAIGRVDFSNPPPAPEAGRQPQSAPPSEPPAEITPDGANSPLAAPKGEPDTSDRNATPLSE